MLRKTLYDIKAYLEYLDKAGCRVEVGVKGGMPEALMQALEEFDAPFDAADGRGRIEVLYGGREAARIFYSPEDCCTAAVVPIRYMLEKALDQCLEYGAHEPDADVYRRSLAFIREHYTEKIGVSDVAAYLGYSSSYFGYVFKKKHGIPANKYILELRLSMAAELLSCTALTVSEVAEKVGFEGANYFSTVFRSVYGMSPRQYRSQNGRDQGRSGEALLPN